METGAPRRCSGAISARCAPARSRLAEGEKREEGRFVLRVPSPSLRAQNKARHVSNSCSLRSAGNAALFSAAPGTCAIRSRLVRRSCVVLTCETLVRTSSICNRSPHCLRAPVRKRYSPPRAPACRSIVCPCYSRFFMRSERAS